MWFLGVRSIRVFVKNMGDPYEPTVVVHYNTVKKIFLYVMCCLELFKNTSLAMYFRNSK